MHVGDELREARTRRQLSIEELSARTKIAASTLRAIEANDAAQLPGGIFTRGFLRAFAREVGLDPEPVVARYMAQFEPPPAVEADTPEGQRRPFPLLAGGAWAPELAARSQGAWITAAVALAVLLVVLYLPSGGGADAERAGGVREPTPAGASGSVGEQRADAVATAGDGSSPAAVGGSASPLHVELRASGMVWVTGTADGKRVLYQMMQPGDTRVIDASRGVVLRVGDAASLEVIVNGTPRPPLGRPGEVVTVRLTPPGV